jgi:regulator of nucleoside diphosphate kinase
MAAALRRWRFVLEDMMNRKTMLGDPPAIHLTQHDLGRPDALLAGLSNASPSLEFLRREVDRATVVADAEAAPFVKLGSRVFFEDETGKRYTGTVGFPSDIAGERHSIPILTLVGADLLCLAEEKSISYKPLHGRTRLSAEAVFSQTLSRPSMRNSHSLCARRRAPNTISPGEARRVNGARRSSSRAHVRDICAHFSPPQVSNSRQRCVAMSFSFLRGRNGSAHASRWRF